MNIKLGFSAATMIVAMSAIAVAQPAAAQNLRAEVHGGWDRVSGDVSSNGLTYGLGAGVDFDIGSKAVVGLEGNADFSNVDACETGILTATDKLCARAKLDASAVVRLGLKVTPSTQLYALAGYTNARFRFDYKPTTGATTRESTNLDGIRVGGGLQQKVGGSAYTKVEYRYSNYEAGAVRHQVIAGVGLAF